jgi:hypothetical protein
LVEDLRRLRCFWGEELERKRGRIRPHDVGDVHDSAPTFVPAATFGQLTEATHGTIANSSNTPTTLNIFEQVSCLSQKPRFIGQATSVINMSRMARHFLRGLISYSQ